MHSSWCATLEPQLKIKKTRKFLRSARISRNRLKYVLNNYVHDIRVQHNVRKIHWIRKLHSECSGETREDEKRMRSRPYRFTFAVFLARYFKHLDDDK